MTLQPHHVEPIESSTLEGRMCILASFNEGLQSQHRSMSTSSAMLLSLQEMFGVQSRSAKQMVMKQIMNTRMAEGTLVRDHIIKMIRLFNELGGLGVDIDWETHNNMVLETLPPFFNQFKLNYSIKCCKVSINP